MGAIISSGVSVCASLGYESVACAPDAPFAADLGALVGLTSADRICAHASQRCAKCSANLSAPSAGTAHGVMHENPFSFATSGQTFLAVTARFYDCLSP